MINHGRVLVSSRSRSTSPPADTLFEYPMAASHVTVSLWAELVVDHFPCISNFPFRLGKYCRTGCTYFNYISPYIFSQPRWASGSRGTLLSLDAISDVVSVHRKPLVVCSGASLVFTLTPISPPADASAGGHFVRCLSLIIMFRSADACLILHPCSCRF